MGKIRATIILTTIVLMLSIPVEAMLFDSPLPEPFEPFAEYTITNDCYGWGVTNWKEYEYPSGSGIYYHGEDTNSENMHGQWVGVMSIEWRNTVRWFYDGNYYFVEERGVLNNPCVIFLPAISK